ncbi:Astra associated protein 1 Asa1 [Dispira simplex]|nr:Astra associated protein 1 Asa1 [Dispira simplex]
MTSVLSTRPCAPVYTFRGQVAEIRSLAFAHGSAYLLSGEESRKWRNLLLAIFVKLSPWGHAVTSFSDETGKVYVWDLLYRRPVLKQTCHDGPVLHIQCPNLTHVITQGRDNTCKLWRLHVQRDAPYLESRVSMECIATMNVDSLNFCRVSVACDTDHPPSPLYIASLHDSTGHKVSALVHIHYTVQCILQCL